MSHPGNRYARNATARFVAFIVILLLMFAYLLSGMIRLQLTDSDSYVTQASNTKTKTIALRGKRGSIIDADSVVLAEDEYIYNVTFYKDSSTSGTANYQAYTRAIIDAIGIIEANGGTMYNDYVIQRNEETGEWEFNFGSGVSDAVLATRESQWRSNNYVTATRYPTAEDCINRLKTTYQIDEVDPNMSEETMLKVMAIYS